jgi:hypothetical protein
VSDSVDLMLEGVLCQVCGVYLGEAVGYPSSCSSCESLEDGGHYLSEEAEPIRRDLTTDPDDLELPF